MKPLDRRLLAAVPGTSRAVAGLAAVGLASGVTSLGLTLSLAALVVAVATGHDGPGLAVVAVPAALLAVRGGLAALGETLAARAGSHVSGGLRRQLVAAELGLGASPRRGGGTAYDGETLVVQGCSSIEVYVARYLPALVTAAVLPALAIVTLVVVDPWSAVVVGLTLPLLPLFAALVGRATQESTQRRWRALSALAGHFGDVMRGLPTLVAYGRGEAQAESVRAVSERHRRATVATLRIAFLSSTALEVLATIAVALVAVLAGVRLAAGDLDLRTALVAILLAPEAYWPIRRVGAEFHAAADGAEALDTVLAHLTSASCGLRSKIGIPEGEFAAQPARSARVGELRGVAVAYPGSPRPVLDGFDLTVSRGLTVVVGPSGSGKTTLLEVLAGLRTADRGTVDVPPAHLVTQRPFLVPGSVGDNLRLGGDHPDDALVHALAAVRLTSLAGVDGAGVLDVPLGDDGVGLSAGQRTRLALARALLAPETLVLLDEPTAHVDDLTADDVVRLVTSLAHDRAVVAVTHDPRLVAAADRVQAIEPALAAAGVAS